MKFLVAVDLEGCACVVGEKNQSLTASKNYVFAKRQGTYEANAAVKALFDAGADEVLVWDAHGTGLNLNYDELDSRVGIVLGSGWEKRMEIVDESFDGLLFIGYHSKDNVSKAILAHTYNSSSFQYIKVNGEEVGEIEIDASIVGEKGVPVIFVSSDEEGCHQAKEKLPWIKTCSTKFALGRNMAVSMHPKKAEDEIYNTVFKSIKELNRMKPFSFDKPIKMEIRYKRIEDAQNDVRYRKFASLDQKNAYNVIYKLENLSEFF